jgi:acyl phosphate:glycerol-3-phosphate acyltransferase
MTALMMTIVGFFLGSLPFSVWLGRLVLKEDVRQYGDGNPGAANVGKAGGPLLGIVAVLLDGLKGAIPVLIAVHVFEISGPTLIPVALAPVVGHAFSPFLGFHGGKAIATTFGIWLGLTSWVGPVVLGVSVLALTAVIASSAWTIILAMFCWLGFMLWRSYDPVFIAVWAGNILIILWKHRYSLGESVKLRPYITGLLHREVTANPGK